MITDYTIIQFTVLSSKRLVAYSIRLLNDIQSFYGYTNNIRVQRIRLFSTTHHTDDMTIHDLNQVVDSIIYMLSIIIVNAYLCKQIRESTCFYRKASRMCTL